MKVGEVSVDPLGKGTFIELQSISGTDQDIVAAARTSMLGESKGLEADEKLLQYLWKHKHLTPFEMVDFKVRVRAPLVVWWQWVRHRTMSYNAQSGRYMEFDEGAFYIPDVWRKQSVSNKQGSDGAVDDLMSIKIANALRLHASESYRLYEWALQNGIAKEQARFFLPGYITLYTFVVKADLRAWLHFCSLRTANDAQLEIRQYAIDIFNDIICPNFPWTAKAVQEFGWRD